MEQGRVLPGDLGYPHLLNGSHSRFLTTAQMGQFSRHSLDLSMMLRFKRNSDLLNPSAIMTPPLFSFSLTCDLWPFLV